MNAGCYGSETWDFVESVLVVDEEGKQFKRAKNEYTTQYRQVTSKRKAKRIFFGRLDAIS